MSQNERMIPKRNDNQKQDRHAFLNSMKKNYQYYLVLVPAVLFFIAFCYIPIYGITMAFREFHYDKGLFFSPWIGFKYFTAFFNYFAFWNLIKNTLIISILKIVVAFPLPILFALILNEVSSLRTKRFIQTASYLPHFISWVTVVALLNQFLGLEGILNQVRITMGLEKIFYMNDGTYFYLIMFGSYVWKTIGYSAIIYISALAGVDPGLYEAATVDGAGRWKRMWYVSIPAILPTAIVLFLLGLSSILSAGWDQIYLLRQPGNKEFSEILDTYIMDMGLRNGQFGYATAVSLFQSVIGLILVLVTNYVIKKKSEVSLF
jgi:putative aldouronate transport system permease protein